MDRNFKQFGTPGRVGRVDVPMNGVPLVGLPFDVFECIPTAVMRCKCKEDNRPITIPGVDVFKKCEHCGKIYGITAVHFDRKINNTVTVTVSLVNLHAIADKLVETKGEKDVDS